MNATAQIHVPKTSHYQVIEFLPILRPYKKDLESLKPLNVRVHVFTEQSEVDEWIGNHTSQQVHNPFVSHEVHPYEVDNPPMDDPGLVFADDDGEPVRAEDSIFFICGLPPAPVTGLVVYEKGDLWVLTPGHNPDRCKLSEIRQHIGAYYKVK